MMVNAKPKQGTWKLWFSGYANAPIVIYTGDRAPDYTKKYPLDGVEWIAEIKHDESPDHEVQIANAALMVAAPELLKALNRIHTRASLAPHDDAEQAQKELDDIYQIAKAAIRKAEGGAA